MPHITQFGTNVNACRKRVYYEGTSAIAEGMPLCYNFDTTTNILGYDKGAGGDVTSQTTPNTTAESYQNEGKFLRVENPALANLDWFAGVVAGTSEAGKTGPRWLEIYIPNGAIVPVKTVLGATVVGRTVLSINSGTVTLGNPTTDVPDFETTSNDLTAGSIDARPVAVAMETISSAGLLLAKLCPDLFVHQGGQNDYEMQIYSGTTNCSVNRMCLQFLNTAGHCQALHYRALLAGDGTTIGDGQKGCFRFETFVGGAAVANKHIHSLSSHLECGGSTTAGGQMSALQLTVRSKNVNPDMTGCGKLSAVHIEWHLRKTTTGELDNPSSMMQIFYINADTTGTEVNRFMYVESMSNIAAYVATGTAAFSNADVMIPCRIGSYNCYLVAVIDDGL